MLYNTLEFWMFFAALFGLYLALRPFLAAQNALLLGASFFFYAYWDWRCLFLLLVTILVDYTCGLLLERFDGHPPVRKKILAVSLSVNLALLGFFKYFNFFIGSFSGMLHSLGVPIAPLHLDIMLPIGISFYTFQTMGYAIDVYARRLRAERNFVDFALFVSFFPQLISGPVERACALLPQIRRPRRVTLRGVAEGGRLVFIGLIKKMVVADNLALIVAELERSRPCGFSVLLSAALFFMRVYADFSGYICMGRGMAGMMGFELSRNFDFPLLSRSISDFWKRWNITLSRWFADYLFYPLLLRLRGLGTAGAGLALFICLTLGGVWHGSDARFLVWGMYNGLLLVGELLVWQWLRTYRDGAVRLPAALGIPLCFLFVTLGNVFLLSPDVSEGFARLGLVFTGFAPPPDALPATALRRALFFVVPLAIVDYFEKTEGFVTILPRALAAAARTAFYVCAFYLWLVFGVFEANEFYYYQY